MTLSAAICITHFSNLNKQSCYQGGLYIDNSIDIFDAILQLIYRSVINKSN